MSEKSIEVKVYSNHKDILKGLEEIAEKAKNKKTILRNLSKTVLNYIENAFKTQGESMGEKWQDWSEEYYNRVRKSIGGDILTLEGDLRKSITRKVNEDNVIISTDREYAAIHNFGMDFPDKNGRNPNMPKRTFMEFTDELEEQIVTQMWGDLKIDEYERKEDELIKELKGNM